MFAAVFIHIILLHAQIGSGLPLLGSTQGSTGVPAVAYRPWILVPGQPLVLRPGQPLVLFQ